MTKIEEKESGYVTVKQLLEEIEQSEAVLFHDQHKEAFIAISGNGQNIIKIKSDEFKQWLSRGSWIKYKQAPSPNTITKVSQTLMGIARFDGPQHRLDVRIVLDKDGLWYDCGNGAAIHVTEAGWQLSDSPPILFQSYQHQKPQTLPVKGGKLEILTNYINLASDNERLLFLAYVVAAFLPGFPHPLLILHGSQGAGKSTPMRVMKELIDPSVLQGLSAPSSLEAFVQNAHHHSFVFFDNLSKMPPWFSDALARASTGDGFSKRTLYTDNDDTFYTLQRPIAINGINQVITKADLLDRSILLKLQRITPDKRKSEEEIWQQFAQDRPKILGAIFKVLSEALKVRKDLVLTGLPRMADFTRWGYAIAEAAGYTGEQFLEAYRDNIALQNEEAIEASPVAQAIIVFMEDKDEWESTPAQLLGALNAHSCSWDLKSSPGWPKEHVWMTRRINEVQPNLSDRGIFVEITRTSGARLIRINKRIDPEEPTDITVNTDVDPDGSMSVETVKNAPSQQGLSL